MSHSGGGGKRNKKVPEFSCPVKYRAGLPDHTAILPHFYSVGLCNISSLLDYRPSALETQSNLSISPFDPFNSSLANFTNLETFSSSEPRNSPSPTKEARMEPDAVLVQEPVTNHLLKEVSKAAAGTPQDSSVITISDTPVTLVSFDHDPLLAPHTVMHIENQGAELDVKQAILLCDSVKLGEWECRELIGTQHDYFIIEGNTAYPVNLRLQLRRKRH